MKSNFYANLWNAFQVATCESTYSVVRNDRRNRFQSCDELIVFIDFIFSNDLSLLLLSTKRSSSFLVEMPQSYLLELESQRHFSCGMKARHINIYTNPLDQSPQLYPAIAYRWFRPLRYLLSIVTFNLGWLWILIGNIVEVSRDRWASLTKVMRDLIQPLVMCI